MDSLRTSPILIVVFFLALQATTADTIILKDGRQITGDLLKSDKDIAIIDLGFEVLRVPQAEIVRIVKPEEKKPATEPASDANSRPSERESPSWQLFRTAKLEPTTIEENVRRFGEAVVMVTSPRGQGSGFVITPDGHCITNYHVIAQETRIKVTVFRKRESGYEQKHYKKVRIIALNPFIDLALMKIDGDGDPFKCVYLGDIEENEVGLNGSPTRVVKIFRPSVARECEKLAPMDEQAMDEAADRLVAFLQEKELL